MKQPVQRTLLLVQKKCKTRAIFSYENKNNTSLFDAATLVTLNAKINQAKVSDLATMISLNCFRLYVYWALTSTNLKNHWVS